MFEIISIVVSALVAIASPASPNSPNFVYIAEAKTKSLASSVLAVDKIPETILSDKITQEKKEGDNVNKDEEGWESLALLNSVRKNDNVEEIKDLIKQYSAQYAVSPEEMTRVMMCESSGKADAIGDNGLAFGLFQFHENTFNLFSKELGEKLDWKNPEHQIKLASWSFANGKQGHWTCYKKTKNF
ncbi:MAG: hypothetical protein UT24_C0052G0009 [Candidatus Woesebacteria bacterium GW2011_GWB1_39_12]|uniref:Transglycosylase SLT domain-containing protein n=1 Tax=Candidatus Woesebacteria bacterium GW2011_GWB1_39_12 TaxID=1618574 RepID=A0A0G0LYZ6_9BACT|nr:MAG: hypothetical protein UT24_C0052G0009 [Candidatus Woesebacteria bacterium GW2011_GWB1_39_12]